MLIYDCTTPTEVRTPTRSPPRAAYVSERSRVVIYYSLCRESTPRLDGRGCGSRMPLPLVRLGPDEARQDAALLVAVVVGDVARAVLMHAAHHAGEPVRANLAYGRRKVPRLHAHPGAGGGAVSHRGPGRATNESLGASIERVTFGRIGEGDTAAPEALAGDEGGLAAAAGGGMAAAVAAGMAPARAALCSACNTLGGGAGSAT